MIEKKKVSGLNITMSYTRLRNLVQIFKSSRHSNGNFNSLHPRQDQTLLRTRPIPLPWKFYNRLKSKKRKQHNNKRKHDNDDSHREECGEAIREERTHIEELGEGCQHSNREAQQNSHASLSKPWQPA